MYICITLELSKPNEICGKVTSFTAPMRGALDAVNKKKKKKKTPPHVTKELKVYSRVFKWLRNVRPEDCISLPSQCPG